MRRIGETKKDEGEEKKRNRRKWNCSVLHRLDVCTVQAAVCCLSTKICSFLVT
jgi:hypothetical protein